MYQFIPSVKRDVPHSVGANQTIDNMQFAACIKEEYANNLTEKMCSSVVRSISLKKKKKKKMAIQGALRTYALTIELNCLCAAGARPNKIETKTLAYCWHRYNANLRLKI